MSDCKHCVNYEKVGEEKQEKVFKCKTCNDTGEVNMHDPFPGQMAYCPKPCPDCQESRMSIALKQTKECEVCGGDEEIKIKGGCVNGISTEPEFHPCPKCQPAKKEKPLPAKECSVCNDRKFVQRFPEETPSLDWGSAKALQTKPCPACSPEKEENAPLKEGELVAPCYWQDMSNSCRELVFANRNRIAAIRRFGKAGSFWWKAIWPTHMKESFFGKRYTDPKELEKAVETALMVRRD